MQELNMRLPEDRERFDAGDIGQVRVRPHKLIETLIPALEAYGWEPTSSEKRKAKAVLTLAQEWAEARRMRNLAEDRMTYWPRDRIAHDAAATLAAGTFTEADLPVPVDLDEVGHKAAVLKQAYEIAEREFLDAVYGDESKFEGRVQAAWNSMTPPGDLLAVQFVEWRVMTQKAASALKIIVEEQASFVGGAEGDRTRLRRATSAAIKDELGAGMFPTLAAIEAADRARQEEVAKAAAAVEAQIEAEREGFAAEAQEAAKYRNPRPEMVEV